MTPLKTVFKFIVGVFAIIGFAYFAFAIYAYLFLFDCISTTAAQAISPNGEYAAVFEQKVCKNIAKSRSEVLLGKRGQKEQAVLLEVRGTDQVGLDWSTDHELLVSYPGGAVVKRYDVGFEGWPRVTFRQTDH